MSAVSLVNLLQSLLNQNTAQGQSTLAAGSAAQLQPAQTLQATAQDEFTPSAQNGQSQATAQAAGLFNVSPASIFSAAAGALLTQSKAAPANVATAAAPAPATVAAQPATAAATIVQAPAPTPAAPAATTAAATSLASAQEQLQSLNLALAALGLSTQDIEQLDQIASTINDYNPSAFTAQAYQLEALARVSAQAASAARANAQANPNNANAPANKTPTGAAKTSNT